jgi:hypothetical protein
MTSPLNARSAPVVDHVVNRRLVVALALLVCAGIGAGAFEARAAEPPPPLMVVVNERNTLKTITREELRNVYLGKLGFWSDNTKVVAFDRPVDREAGQSFYRDILKMVPARFRHHWQSQQLSGRGIAPEPVAGVDDVIARVAAVPGGIAYLHTSEVPKVAPKGVFLISVAPEK